MVRQIHALIWLALVMLMGMVPVSRAWAETNDCAQPPKDSHYIPLAGDVESATHFEADRAFSGKGRLELNVCAGELLVRRSKDGEMRISIETGKVPDQKMRAYVKTLDVQADHATISLQFPRNLHPLVILEVPAEMGLRSEVNLGAGKLEFYADGIGGDRQINVGAGSATLYLSGDRDYAHLDANVGMGSFHDHRPGGGSAHFVISRNFQGRGSGPLEINVGAGSLDLEPAGD